MAYGDIGAAVLDSEEFEPVTNWHSVCFKRADGILVIFHSDAGNNGVCQTYPVATDGTIGTKIAELEFDADFYFGRIQTICEVATGIYLAIYRGNGSVLTAKSISVSADGATLAVVDTLVTGLATSTAVECVAKKGTTNTCYVAIWHGAGQDGFIATITCDADGDNIANPDSWEFEPTRGYLPQVAFIQGDIFALSYSPTSGSGLISSVSIADDGTISKSLIDTQAVDTGGAANINMLKIDNGDLVVVAYVGPGSDGWMAVFNITAAGAISAPIDTVEFDAVQASWPQVLPLGTTSSVSYVVVIWTNPTTDDCDIASYSVDAAGDFSAQIDTLNLNSGSAASPLAGCQIQPDVWAFIYTQSPSQDGFVVTVSVETVPDFSNDAVYVELAGTEIQDKVFGLRITRGRESELKAAATGVAEITVNNEDGDFSPENSGGAYYGTLDLGNTIYVYEIYGGVTYDIFVGTIEKVVPSDTPDDATAFILATDGMDDLNVDPIDTVLRTTVKSGVLIDDILTAAGAFTGVRDLDTGVDTFDVAWFAGLTALAAIRSLEDQERSFFYIDVDGDAQWEDRHHRLKGAHLVSQYDFEDENIEVLYEWSKRELYNQIRIVGTKYTADPSDEYLWGTEAGVAATAVTVPPGGSVTIWATFNQALASFVAFVQGTHWNTNTAVDKTGTDTSDDVSVAITQYGKSLKIVFTSTSGSNSFLVVPDSPSVGSDSNRSAIVMGKMYQEDQIRHIEDDTTSQTAYKKKALPISTPFKSDPDKLRVMAEWLVALHKDPAPRSIVARFHARANWPTDALLKQMLVRRISDRVTLKSTRLGYDQDFYIDKVVHDWGLYMGKLDLKVEWTLSRASDLSDVMWILEEAGYGELSETTYLGF